MTNNEPNNKKSQLLVLGLVLGYYLCLNMENKCLVFVLVLNLLTIRHLTLALELCDSGTCHNCELLPTHFYTVQRQLLHAGSMCVFTLWKENGLSYQHRAWYACTLQQSLSMRWPGGQKIKKWRPLSYETIVVAWLLVKCAAVAVCYCCRCGTARRMSA